MRQSRYVDIKFVFDYRQADMPHFDLHLKRFPDTAPGYEPIPQDPIFDPQVHLQLERPSATRSLDDLGYGKDILQHTPSSVAVTSSFRILSEQGVADLYKVCKQLEQYTTSNPRISRNLRGGVYRSKFLRDFSLNRELNEHLSSIMQTPLQPHAMGHQLAHINFQPFEIGENVDRWHFDTLQTDFVLFVTDPNDVVGGEFQYFNGTREQMAALNESGEGVPEERIVTPDYEGAGCAVLMQGNFVVHQARGLQQVGERITLVNAYSYLDQRFDDYTALNQLMCVDPDTTVAAEYARQMALRSAQHLVAVVNQSDFSIPRAEQAARLAFARDELNKAIDLLQDDRNEEMQQFNG